MAVPRGFVPWCVLLAAWCLSARLCAGRGLPLRVVSVTPSQGPGHGEAFAVPIGGRAAITITFSKAFIALGSDFGEGPLQDRLLPVELHPAVPGRWRWVTTSILRFDPAAEWPTDLQLELQVKPGAADFTGDHFSSGSHTAWHFSTAALTMTLEQVDSDRARKLTNGRWESGLCADDNGPEVPPDGRLQLRFSGDVDRALLRHELILRPAENADSDSQVPFDLEACGAPPSQIMPRGRRWAENEDEADSLRCAVLVLRGELEVDGRYDLILPAGSKLNALAGPTATVISIRLRGLLSFVFPFQPPSEYETPMYQRQRLWLRHGLRDDVDMAALTARFRSEPPLEFSCTRAERAVLELSAKFEPGVTYRLFVDGSEEIRDGFGLPLQSSNTTFRMAGLQNVLASPNPYRYGGGVSIAPKAPSGQSESSQLRWPVLFRGKSLCLEPDVESFYKEKARSKLVCETPQRIDFVPVRAENIKEVIASLQSERVTHVQEDRKSSSISAPLSEQLELRSVEVSPGQVLLSTQWEAAIGVGDEEPMVPRPAGRFAGVQSPSRGPRKTSSLVGRPTLVASMVAAPGEVLLVWVTKIGNTAPVPGATVTLYCTPFQRGGAEIFPTDVFEMMVATTDSRGVARLSPSKPAAEELTRCRGRRWLAVLAFGEAPLIQANPPTSFAAPPPGLRGQLLTDRGVYKPGDTIMIKGYVRKQMGSKVDFAKARGDFTLSVRWGDGRAQTENVVVAIDRTFGSFEARLKVPADARYRDTSISFYLQEEKGRRSYLASASITVADPRPPTVTLDAAASPAYLRLGENVSLKIHTSTLTGVPLADSDVKVNWHVVRDRGPVIGYRGGGDVIESEDIEEDEEEGDEDSSDDDEGGRPACGASRGALNRGELRLRSGPTGEAELEWQPPKAAKLCAGDALALRFEWVGPTRELLVRELRVPVARSPTTLALQLKTASDPVPTSVLPGVPFRVGILLSQLQDLGGRALPGVPLRVDLRRVVTAHHRRHVPALRDVSPDDQGLTNGTEIVSSCPETTTGASQGLSCELVLPSMGSYVVTACAGPSQEAPTGAGNLHADDSNALCSTLPVGKSEEAWKQKPLQQFLKQALQVSLEQRKYQLGEAPVVSLFNPRPGLRAFAVWGGQAHQRNFVSGTLDGGHVSLQLPALGDECSDGCRLLLLFASTSNASNTVPVPASPILDPTLPESATKTFDLEIARGPVRELTVSLEVDQKVALPGSEQRFKISLTDASGAPAKGQVCVFAVDQAMLDLKPHPPANLTSAFEPRPMLPGFTQDNGFDQLASPSTLLYTTEWMQQVAALDPWLLPGPGWPLRPNPYRDTNGPELSPEEFAKLHTYDLTVMAPGGGMMPLMMSTRNAPMLYGGAMPMLALAAGMAEDEGMPEMASLDAAPQAMRMKSRSRSAPMPAPPSAGGAGGSGSSVVLRARSLFEATPLFRTVVVDGTSTETWRLPDNTGRFELRAYAVGDEPDVFGGGSTASQIVRRPATLTPSLPRVARVGDGFGCGATLTLAEAPVAQAHMLFVAIELEGPASAVLLPPQPDAPDATSVVKRTKTSVTKRIAFQPGEPLTQEVVFLMSAQTMGNQSVVITVSDSAGELDKLRVSFPVLATQPEVYVATSMAITATKELGLPWEEGLVLPAAVNGSGHLRMQAGVGHLPVVQNIVRGFLQLPDADSASPPSAIDLLCAMASAALLRPYQQAAGALADEDSVVIVRAVKEIGELTTTAGLHYSKFSFVGQGRRQYVDLHLNAFALFVLRRLHLAGVELPVALRRHEEIWRNALVSELSYRVQQALDSPRRRFDDFETLAACHLALGSRLKAEALSPDVWNAISLEALYEHVDSLSIFARAALVTLHFASDIPEQLRPPEDAQHELPVRQFLQSFASSLRVTGRTAYIARSSGSRFAADLRSNSMALSALALAKKKSEEYGIVNVERLANYVANGGGAGTSGMSSLFAAFGLVDYDVASGNAHASVNFKALAGDMLLFNASLSSSVVQSKDYETAWDALPSQTCPLLFEAEGVGEVFAAVGLRFVPAAIVTQPVYRGIDVQKVIQAYDAKLESPTGPPLTSIVLGSIVTVTLQITSPDGLSGLLVEDWLPAGLEAIDPNLANGRGHSSPADCPPWQRYMFCTFFSRETKSDRVLFYTSYLSPGTHSVSFEAVAATRGLFAIPPGRAHATLEPEVMGLSAGGQLEIYDARVGGSPAAAEALPAPKFCPGDCFGRGECDTVTGTCRCFPGAAGADCSEVATAPNLTLRTLVDGATLVIRTVAGVTEHSIEVGLSVGDGASATESARWLFARTSPLSGGGRRLRGGEELSVRVDRDAGRLLLDVPSTISEVAGVKLHVMGSRDGLLFGRTAAEVWVYPECVPGRKRRCGADGRFREEEPGFDMVPDWLYDADYTHLAITFCAVMVLLCIASRICCCRRKHVRLVSSAGEDNDVYENLEMSNSHIREREPQGGRATN